jgi:hypothetical protein
LGIPPGSDEDEISSAFKKLCIIWHPDKHPTSSKEYASAGFQAILTAKTTLIGEFLPFAAAMLLYHSSQTLAAGHDTHWEAASGTRAWFGSASASGVPA